MAEGGPGPRCFLPPERVLAELCDAGLRIVDWETRDRGDPTDMLSGQAERPAGRPHSHS